MKNKFLLTFVFLSAILDTYSQSIQITNVSRDIFCSFGGVKDTMAFLVNYSNIPQNTNIVFYQSTNPNFNPYTGGGDSIGFINIGGGTTGGGAITTTCPKILGIFIDACDQPAPLREVDNEYIVITSGSGFQVSNLKLQMPNSSINISSCTFATPSAATMAQLRIGTCNSTTLLPAGQADSIPPNAIVIIFTGNGALYNYNFSSYCSSGQPIYILQNSCSPGTANFVNNAPGSCPGQYRTTFIRNRNCFDALTYNPCSLPVYDGANPNANDGNYVIHLPNTDTSSTTNGGIRNNAADKCNGLRFDSISGATIIKFPIPNDGSSNPLTNFCNTGFHYIKAITNPPGTLPISNEIQFKLVCLDITSTPVSSAICSGQNAVINNSSSDPNAVFSWTVSGGVNISGASGGSGSQINQTLINTSTSKDSITYSITADDAGCTANKQVKIYVNLLAVKPNLGNDTSFCGAFSKILSTGNPATVWSTGVTASSITVTQGGTYTAAITSACGTLKDTIVITQTSGINFDFGTNTTTVCNGGSISLDASNAYDSYLWNTGSASNIISITQPGKYWVDVFKNGCKGSDTIAVTQIQQPVKPFIGKDTAFCGTFSKVLSTGNTAANWFNGATPIATNTTSITATQAGTYIAVITNSCGSVADTIVISQTSTQTKPNLGNDTSYCGAFSKTLTTGNAATVWSTGVTASSITVTQAGTYTATITGSCGNISDTITISQGNSANKPFIGSDTTYCGSFSRILTTGIAQTIWTRNTAAVSTAASITITQGGTYVATISDICGTVSDTIIINNSNALNVNLGKDTLLCAGQSIVLNATVAGNNITYLWNTGEQTPKITVPAQFKRYIVEVSNGNCTATDTIIVDSTGAPVKPTLGNDTSFCGDFSKVLFTGDVNTIWSTGAVGIQITVTTPGIYIAENKNQCGNVKDTISFLKFAPPIVNLGKDTTTCDSILLNVGNGIFNSIVWSTGDTVKTIIVTVPGLYSVVVTNDNCSKLDSIRIAKDCDYDVYIPTAFSPNGDNLNDVIVPLSFIKGIEVVDFIIFDRWGEKVFETKNFAPNDIAKGWNGIYKGDNCAVDDYVYYYIIKLQDGKMKTYKGTFALIK